MAAQIELVKNDTLPSFGGTVDFDLTGYTATLHIDFPIPLVKEATILTTGVSESTFEFVFDVGDLNEDPGTYDFEVQFDNGSGGIVTYKMDEDEKTLQIKLRDEIA